MDQQKIGKFIAECRKKQGLTQMQLAEKLNITDRAVSKWENGRSMPDSSIMLELCSLLGITVNDLLTGEVVGLKDYNKELENNLLEMVKQKEEADKRLLFTEIIVGFLSSIILFCLVFTASFADMQDWLRLVIILIGMMIFSVGIAVAVSIEQKAGYYKCQNCGHAYVPSYKSVLFAMHVNRTRYMKCPECHKRTWQKKVLTK